MNPCQVLLSMCLDSWFMSVSFHVIFCSSSLQELRHETFSFDPIKLGLCLAGTLYVKNSYLGALVPDLYQWSSMLYYAAISSSNHRVGTSKNNNGLIWSSYEGLLFSVSIIHHLPSRWLVPYNTSRVASTTLNWFYFMQPLVYTTLSTVSIAQPAQPACIHRFPL